MNTEHHHNKNVVSIEWAVIKSRKEWRVFGLFFLLSKWLSVNLWIHLTGWKKVYISANNRYRSLSSRVCERIRLNSEQMWNQHKYQFAIHHSAWAEKNAKTFNMRWYNSMTCIHFSFIHISIERSVILLASKHPVQ